MILTIDIGNTNTKFGIYNNDKLAYSFRLSSRPTKTSDEYGVDILTQLARHQVQPKDIKGIIVGSVNPSLNFSYERVCEYFFDIKPLFVGSGIKTGIDVKYDNPKNLGADRIADCVGAVHKYGSPLIVVDCGTATAFNVVNSQRQFVGGVISIGLNTSAESLSKNAAKLPEFDFAIPSTVVGRNTITNMQSGIVYGFVGAVEKIIELIKIEIGIDCKVVATGGQSELLKQHSQVIDVIDRSLTLDGLYQIYLANNAQY
ncbi:MAG: type III pantothenate kinase [Firmicutes bacterium]|nr:type III pantothenate kinase [Bacillota bacterium]MCL1953887.1 type III pantothenate kinase [Bacillota bacterium]